MMLKKVLKQMHKGDFYVQILPQWLKSLLYTYFMKHLLGIAAVLHRNQTVHSSISPEHVITWQINQHSLHSKIQRDRFTPWFHGDLQSEVEMKRAQGFSCSSLPVLLQAVPAGKGPWQCCLPIKRSHTFLSTAFWKSSKANIGKADDLGPNLVLGLLGRYLSAPQRAALAAAEPHTPQPAREGWHSFLENA